MALTVQLVEQPWFKRLSMRAGTFYQMIKHLDQSPGGRIIETGCAWDKDNFEGQGQSTLIWDWVLSNRQDLYCTSIDATPKSIDNAKAQVQHVNLILGDSVKVLNAMPSHTFIDCRLLYLDSFDWTPELNLESAFHHMAELACVWPHLPSGCMIAVDDRHGVGVGKHWLVEAFMTKLKIEPVFCEYQIGWVKP